MKGNAVDVAGVLVERVHALLRVAIPELDSLVIGGAHDEPRIVRESNREIELRETNRMRSRRRRRRRRQRTYLAHRTQLEC